MGRLGNRVTRLEKAAEPTFDAPRIVVTFVSPDGADSRPFTFGEDGTLRPLTAEEIASGGPEHSIALIDRAHRSVRRRRQLIS